jgi:hypothetical protein
VEIMTKTTKNPPDWWARGIAIFGSVLTIIGLIFTLFNYRWQTKTYQESLEERVFVRLFASLAFQPVDRATWTQKWSLWNPKGLLGVEIVNLGMRPVFSRTLQPTVRTPILLSIPTILLRTSQ